MRIGRILLSFLLLLLTFDLQAETLWPKIAHRIMDYAANPSPATAIAALNTIPEASDSFSDSPEAQEANKVIYASGPMGVLEQRVLMRERESVALAFRMREIADGAFLEDLDIILGKLVRIAPEQFLAELQRANVPPKAMGGLVGNLGEDFVDQVKRQCEELQLRRRALDNVMQPSLKQAKTQALAALSKRTGFCRKSP